MTPEEAARMQWVYHPPAEEVPEINGHASFDDALKPDYATTIWTARLCWGGAFLIFGFLLGRAI